MVDTGLLERVLQLDVDSRREFVRAVEDSLGYDDVPASVRSEVERRLGEMGPDPATDYITLDEFKQDIANRRSQRSA
jgi:hypothetical protein